MEQPIEPLRNTGFHLSVHPTLLLRNSCCANGILSLFAKQFFMPLRRKKRSFLAVRVSGKIEGVFSEYIDAAMEIATFEELDDGTIYGSIPGLQGVWSNADTAEAVQIEFEEVLEEWIALRLSRNLPIPAIHGISLAAPA